MVLGLRFVDRIGKGLRNSPRDALIADVTPAALRGHAYGLRQAMDHMGAVLGPLVAALLLSGAGLSMRTVFLLSIVPGVLVVLAVTLGVREPAPGPARAATPPDGAAPTTTPSPITLLGAWGGFSPGFRRYLGVMALFTLGNSTDAFLLIQLNRQGLPPPWVATLWAAFHVVKVVSTMGLARLSDRIGRRPLLLAGWGIYALVYLGFATMTDLGALVAIFLAYGIYFGCAEATQQAWVADLVPGQLRGSAFGYFHGAVGLTALPASLLFGALLDRLGAGAAFGTGAALALLAAALLFTIPRGDAAQPDAAPAR
jgi:MFS family permease